MTDAELSDKFHKYLMDHNKSDLLDILKNSDKNQSYSITVNFMILFEEDNDLGNGLLLEPEKYLSALNEASILAQRAILKHLENTKEVEEYDIKFKVYVRIDELPVFEETVFPNHNDLGFFVKINGTLIKAGIPKLLEYQRDYLCLKCNSINSSKAAYEKYYVITPPTKCKDCYSNNLKPNKEIDIMKLIDYQEIKVQEHFGKSKVGTMPRTILVTLEGDLVDSCKPGDDVIIIGILLRRWKPVKQDTRCDINLVLKANNIKVSNEQKIYLSNKEVKKKYSEFWEHYKHNELTGRNLILKSFCPQIFGLHLAKLSLATVLAGGVQKNDENGCSTRGMSHLLLVGDAGTGKSHLLRYASKIANHSVFTAGVGSTSAGLTVTAVRENSDWNLEAGALVLADGGICCIDDFNSIREHDRTSIHEAMEQQSISVAKAGIVTKLHTRCSVLATTTTKEKYDCSIPMSVNVSISSPLLSRFDIVLILLDSKCPDWDKSLCNFVFESKNNYKDTQSSVANDARDHLIHSIWSTTDIQSYFSIIKEINPVMSEEAGIVLRAYYQFQRMTDSRNAARTTVRLLESLIRLSQGHARLMFREKVTVMDALTAVSLIESSMHNSTYNKGINALHTVLPENPLDEYISLAKTILPKLKLHRILEEELRNIEKNRIMLSEKITPKINTPSNIIENNFSSQKEFNDTPKPHTEEVFQAKSQIQEHIFKSDEDILESMFSDLSGSNIISDLFYPKSSGNNNTPEKFLSKESLSKLHKVRLLSQDPKSKDNQESSPKRIKLISEDSDKIKKEGDTTESDTFIASNQKKIVKNSAESLSEEHKKLSLMSNINSPNTNVSFCNATIEKSQNLRRVFSKNEDDWNYLDL